MNSRLGSSGLHTVRHEAFMGELFLTTELLRALRVLSGLGEYPRGSCSNEGFGLKAFPHGEPPGGPGTLMSLDLRHSVLSGLGVGGLGTAARPWGALYPSLAPFPHRDHGVAPLACPPGW